MLPDPAAFVVESVRYLDHAERGRATEAEREVADREGRRPRKIRSLSRPTRRTFQTREAAAAYAAKLRHDEPDSAWLAITIKPKAAPVRPVQLGLDSGDPWPVQHAPESRGRRQS